MNATIADRNQRDKQGQYVFICGAVGSGNTFLFDCMTRDENIYGVNEDALGATLERLVQSEKDFARCPHSVDTFLAFLDALRRDRRTLVLKTPSNLRRRKLIGQYLADSHFIVMVREPHAAIVSGLRRHEAGTEVEKIARTWLNDYRESVQPDNRTTIVLFENLIRQPSETLRRIDEQVMTLTPIVFQYAQQLASPQRATPAWWRSSVDGSTQVEIERWVRELRLDKYYEELCHQNNVGNVATDNQDLVRIGSVRRAIDKLREWSVKGRYRVSR